MLTSIYTRSSFLILSFLILGSGLALGHNKVVVIPLMESSCKGGDGSIITRSFQSADGRDGYIYSEDGVKGYLSTSGDISVGDNLGNFTRRGFVSFGIVGLTGRCIESAELHLYQIEYIGDPLSVLGYGVWVEHFQIGNVLDETDFEEIGLQGDIVGSISTSSDVGWRVLDVTPQVARDAAAGRFRSEFRLRFAGATDSNEAFDAISFVDSNDYRDTGNPPVLIIRYR